MVARSCQVQPPKCLQAGDVPGDDLDVSCRAA